MPKKAHGCTVEDHLFLGEGAHGSDHAGSGSGGEIVALTGNTHPDDATERKDLTKSSPEDPGAPHFPQCSGTPPS